MNSTAISIVDLSAIKHNLQLIHAMLPRKKVMVMVKSNAYGHGLVRMTKALTEVDALGVATIAEAKQLREAGIDTDIVVMRGFATHDEMSIFLEDKRLIACIHDDEQVCLLERLQTPHSMRIWLKIDTGMHRLGVSADVFHHIYHRLNQLSCIQKEFVVCSHLADADNMDTTFTQKQIATFDALTNTLPNEKSILNSAGILAHSDAAYDWVRPGLLLYGVSPFYYSGAHDVKMRDFIPAMTLESKIIAIKNVRAGEKIGYSCTYTAPHDMRIAIVGMGYGDSYPRQAQNGTPVLVQGQRCPIVGRVSMDMITIDVSHLRQVAVEDTVTLWGRDLSVVEIAKWVNTISHELLCHLTGRVQRVYY